MKMDSGVDLITLIAIVVMVCVATFTCTFFGRFCFDRFCRTSGKGRRCPHGVDITDIPCPLCVRVAADMDYFTSSWRPYHPSLLRGLPNMNYAALLAAERQNTYLHPINRLPPNESPGPTDLVESGKDVVDPGASHIQIGEESGTFKRLGIRQSMSGRRDLSGLARQLENRNLSPIQQTPPDTQYPHDLSIAATKTRTPPHQTSHTSSFGSFRQRRSSSFRRQSLPNDNINNSTNMRTSRSIPIRGIKRIFSRPDGPSDVLKSSPYHSPRKDSSAAKPSPRRRLKSPSNNNTPPPAKLTAAPSPSSSTAAPTTIEIESEKDEDENKKLGAPGGTIPGPLTPSNRQSISISISEDDEVFKPPLSTTVKTPRLSSAGGKIRTARHRSLNNDPAGRLYNDSIGTTGFRLKRFKSLEDDHTLPNMAPNFCSFCGQYLITHAKNRSGGCVDKDVERKKFHKPTLELFKPSENEDDGEKTSSNSLGSPGIKSIIESLNAATTRSNGPSPNNIKAGYVNIPISEADKFSIELEKRGTCPLTETMFEIPSKDMKIKPSHRKSVDVENSIKPVKSPVKNGDNINRRDSNDARIPEKDYEEKM